MLPILEYIPHDRGQRHEFLRVFLRQTYYTFNQAIPLMAILGVFAGLSVALQARLGLSFVGGNDSLGQIVVVVLIRELAPLMSSLVLIARSATAVASELATMKVQQEIDALLAMRINIKQYLLGPRLLAATISIFCMAVCFVMAGIVGAWFGCNFWNYYPLFQFLNSISLSLAPADIFFFIAKTCVIGQAIFMVAIKSGMSLKKAPFEVPIVTNQAVVDALFVAIGIQIFISGIFYLWIGLKI
ncbi:MAG: ABC transporter permease [Bdellovibrionota bacterium]